MADNWEMMQLKEARKRVKRRFGDAALGLLSQDMRAALVKAEVLSIIAVSDGMMSRLSAEQAADAAKRFAALASLGVRAADPLEPIDKLLAPEESPA